MALKAHLKDFSSPFLKRNNLCEFPVSFPRMRNSILDALALIAKRIKNENSSTVVSKDFPIPNIKGFTLCKTRCKQPHVTDASGLTPILIVLSCLT